jgi:hypothetical protein
MSRVPFDIQFLLESILSESPDKMFVIGGTAKRLIDAGADVKDATLAWDMNSDAVPFYIDQEENVVVFCKMNTHGRMERALNHASNIVVDPIMFDSDCKEKTHLGCPGIYVQGGIIPVSLYFYGLKKDGLEGITEYLKENRKRLKRLVIRGHDAKKEAVQLCGRLWHSSNAISFWNQKDEIKPFFNLMFDFMKQCGMNPSKCAFEFVDSKQMYAYKELGGNVDDKDKLSPDEVKALQRQQHLDAKAKAKLFGPEYKDAHLKKAGKGFPFAAAADAAMPALEGHIKLKDLLKENPDFVSTTEGGKIAHYYDADAIAFFAYSQFSILNQGGVHYDMLNTLRDVHNDIEDFLPHPDEVEYLMDDQNLLISSTTGVLDALQHGTLGKYFEKYSADYSDGSDSNGTEPQRSNSNDAGAFRTRTGGLAGRIWTKKKIISFWNRKEDVVKQWDDVKKMFSDFAAMLGSLDDYRVDWLERDLSQHLPLTPASQVSTSSGNEKDQTTFLDALFGDTKISDEDIKKLQARLHTMSAKEKKKLMMAMGYKNTKASDIADKLGMTVAEFNHIMNVNEGDV